MAGEAGFDDDDDVVEVCVAGGRFEDGADDEEVGFAVCGVLLMRRRETTRLSHRYPSDYTAVVGV
jgi:hypothetical protein